MIATATERISDGTALEPFHPINDTESADFRNVTVEMRARLASTPDGEIDLERELYEDTAQIIRGKARQLKRRPEFRSCSENDLFQELAAHFSRRLGAFDARRGSYAAFVATVVKNRARQLIQNARAKKRDDRRVCSLDRSVPIGGDGASLLAHGATEEHIYSRRHFRRMSDQSRAELRMDIETALESCPAALRKLARRLMWSSLSEIAAELHIPRSTLQYQLTKLRQRFEDRRLAEYFSD